MEPTPLNRRSFLLRSLATGAGAMFLSGEWAEALAAAHAPSDTLAFFTPAEMRITEAMAERILPAGDGFPGARATGAAQFIDRALTTFFAEDQSVYRDGFVALAAKTRELHGADAVFDRLDAAKQDAVLTAIEETEFFQYVRAETLLGCVTMPKYGGNIGEAGWKLLGFEHRPVNSPPFGFYDRGYVEPAVPPAAPPPATLVPPVPPDSGRRPRFAPSDVVDFVIVGAGAAGGVIAWELARAGMRVVVLEQGPYLTERDFDHDEISVLNQNALTNDAHTQPQTFRKTPDEVAKRDQPLLYGRAVGGGSLHFTANYWRLRPIDFRERSVVGDIGGAALADWPLSYDDLEPYYTRAEHVLGVSGLAGANPFEPRRSAPYPLPPMPVKSGGVLFERAARKLGWHPFPAPVAVLSRPHRGRAACQHCGFCQGFGCEYGAKSSSLASVIREAERTGNVEIRTHSYARKIELDARGRATGIVYFDEDRREVLQRARAVVLAANGAETPRLLLMSRSSLFPDGLANSSGMVGKHLMFNGNGAALGFFPEPLNEWKSVQASRVVWDFYDHDPARGAYGGGGFDARFGPLSPGDFVTTLAASTKPSWGEGLRKRFSAYSHMFMVATHSTSLPVPTNAVDLDPELKDDWGLPAMRVTYRDHADDLATTTFLQKRGMELLEAAGALDPIEFPVEEQRYAVHLLGTCRMGDDPRSSVIDRNHRTHDVPNLFLCDGSSLVTSGRGQPTCTIQTLAFRAGELMAKAAKRNEI